MSTLEDRVGEILERASALVGTTIGEALELTAPTLLPSLRTKGDVGGLYERFFGVGGGEAGPDFADVGIELKSVPLIKKSGRWQAKERTAITQINYRSVCDLPFDESVLDVKTRRILFVFFAWHPNVPSSDFVTLGALLHARRPFDEALLRDAYEHVREMTLAGRAHELSEAQTPGVGACTKGSGANLVRQPFSETMARGRAFAFRSSFTTALWNESRAATMLLVPAATGSVAEFERAVLARMRPFRGLQASAISDRVGDVGFRAKSALATLTRRMLGAPASGRLSEFEKMGTVVRTVKVRADGRPYESMSFPYFRPDEVMHQTWEESTFAGQLASIFVTVFEGSRSDRAAAEFRGGFFWHPLLENEAVIRREWGRAIELIAASRLGGIPKASETVAVHVRPHARDRSDRIAQPDGTLVTKQSFWLNRDFVSAAIRQHEL